VHGGSPQISCLIGRRQWQTTLPSGRQSGLDIPNLPSAKAENLASFTASSATQCRSNPVSGRGLPKTGIFQISAGDYWRFRSRSGQFGSPETDSQFAKARYWWAFLRLQRVKSPGAGLPGWRRSADRTRLHANSLLTGNFTGNSAISGPRRRFRSKKPLRRSDFSHNSLRKLTGKIFRRTG
jgi:hypothetical protein